MGRSIVYCDKCGQLLKEDDFRQGKASTADNRSYCAACRPTGTSTAIPKVPGAPHISTSRLPKQPGQESRRIQVQPPPPSAPPAPPPKSNTPLIVGGAIAAVVVLGLVFAMMSGSKPPPRKEEPVENVVAYHPPPPVEKATPEERQLEESARTACVKAYGVLSTRPKDLAAQWRAFEEAVLAARGTSYAGDADAQLGKVRRKMEEERAALEVSTQAAVAREQFQSALRIWEPELKRYDVAPWTKAVEQRLAELRADFERRLAMTKDAAAEAKKRGDENEAKSLRAKVAAWGIPGYAEQVDQALAAVVPDKPAPPAEDADKSKRERESYLNRWKEIFGPVAAREYGEAAKLLEKLLTETKDEQLRKDCSRDLENLKLAAAFIAESAPLLGKLPKGQKLVWTFADPNGTLVRLEEVVLKIDATRVEVKWEEGSRVISFGEVGAATLNELTKGKSARGAAVACALEGDEEGAKKLGVPLPDYYAVLGHEATEARVKDEKESAARSLFAEAERDYFDASEQAAAVARYKRLLGEFPGTAFVRRNKAAIAARTESTSRDFLFANADLLATSGFKLGKYAKVDAAWVSQADVDTPKMKDTYIEFGFPAAADTDYKIWILAGGCCQEVFTCYAQGSELLGPDPANPKEKILLEPGSGAGLLIKPPSMSKKLHSQHTGPKNPERFEWIQAASIKYAQAGAKKVRILTNQKGFAVATAAALSTRPGPPRDLDFKELEKWKAETPGSAMTKAQQPGGTILREFFRGIGGGGVGDLVNNQAFKDDKPTETVQLKMFEAGQGGGNDYGSRVRGYIHPPATGAYVFWIATDDQGELKLSTDEDPAKAKTIATVREWCGERDYTKFPAQQSQPIELKAGRRYYIEALHKQGGGGDHISVAWRLPNGTEEKPIPGNRLSPFIRK